LKDYMGKSEDIEIFLYLPHMVTMKYRLVVRQELFYTFANYTQIRIRRKKTCFNPSILVCFERFSHGSSEIRHYSVLLSQLPRLIGIRCNRRVVLISVVFIFEISYPRWKWKALIGDI
ncbi:hypothetical protein T05_4811, partial [Trichinella murrelli]